MLLSIDFYLRVRPIRQCAWATLGANKEIWNFKCTNAIFTHTFWRSIYTSGLVKAFSSLAWITMDPPAHSSGAWCTQRERWHYIARKIQKRRMGLRHTALINQKAAHQSIQSRKLSKYTDSGLKWKKLLLSLHQMESGGTKYLNILTQSAPWKRQLPGPALISISQSPGKQNPSTHSASISIYLFHSRGGGAGQKGPCHNQKLV